MNHSKTRFAKPRRARGIALGLATARLVLLSIVVQAAVLSAATQPRLLAPSRVNPFFQAGPPILSGSPGQFASATVSGFSLNLRPLKANGDPAQTEAEVATIPTSTVGVDDNDDLAVRMRGVTGGADYFSTLVQGAATRDETLLTVDEQGNSTATQLLRKVSWGRVPRPFPLRLIVHQDTNSLIRLLQRIYVGLRKEGTNEYAAVLATKEGALDSQNIDSARRISTAHLPWSDGNATWNFTGSLAPGGQLRATVTLNYDNQASNPFLHTYHPDHDNKNVGFNATLAQGFESYTVQRDITLRISPPDSDFESLTRGSSQLGGVFEETMIFKGKGAESKRYDVRGAFVLNRISDISELITE